MNSKNSDFWVSSSGRIFGKVDVSGFDTQVRILVRFGSLRACGAAASKARDVMPME
jgi:hypothetical protein